MNDYSMVITTAASLEEANSIAKVLLDNRLAACVQMFNIKSMYIWQGEVCESGEVALHIKSKTILFNEIKKAIKANHSYDVPEIIQIPITDGSSEYLEWIKESTIKESTI